MREVEGDSAMLYRPSSWVFWTVLICAGEVVGDQSAEPSRKANDQATRETKFQQELSGAVLSGHFTETDQSNQQLQEGLKEEKYTISSVKKLSEDLWLFQTRIQYGDHDLTLPLPLRVRWAGDTPVITVDRVPVPGLGTFTARVMIYDSLYAGTWSGGDHGGHLFGRIVRQAASESPPD